VTTPGQQRRGGALHADRRASLTCLPIWIAGYLYCRQDGKISFGRAFLCGHLLLIGNYVTFVSCWRAFYRLVAGATRWQKTARHAERPAAAVPGGPPVVLTSVAAPFRPAESLIESGQIWA